MICRRFAFSLVELLVVIGIIGILIAILLPALAKIRESGKRTACLSNVRQLAIAVTAYIAENSGFLPEAGSTNIPLEGPLAPRGRLAPAWTPLTGEKYVLPSIGGLLEKYLGNSTKIWKCPSAAENTFVVEGNDPMWGHLSPNAFKPNYNFVAGKEYYELAMLGGPLVAQVKVREWAARNISGLRVNKAVPAGQNASRVVTVHDRASTYHSRHRRDIYTWTKDEDYYASYAYLDGHAEGQRYRNVNGYLKTIHNPIRQTWYGVDFTKAFPEQYTP